MFTFCLFLSLRISNCLQTLFNQPIIFSFYHIFSSYCNRKKEYFTAIFTSAMGEKGSFSLNSQTHRISIYLFIYFWFLQFCEIETNVSFIINHQWFSSVFIFYSKYPSRNVNMVMKQKVHQVLADRNDRVRIEAINKFIYL